LDSGFSTVLHLKNTINQPVFALVQVLYGGGSYNLERLPLAPFQSIAVDLRALRDGQQKDIRDSVMPSDVEGGQVIWFEETVGSLIGRAEVRNVSEGVASSFSCGNPCSCPPASSNTYLTPGSSVGPMGGTAQFSAKEELRDCNNQLFGPYNRTSNSTWSSDHTNVFTVSGGLVSCLQPGSGRVTAVFQATVYGQWCAPIYIHPRPSAPVAVKPLITVSPTTFMPNPITISGGMPSMGSVSISASPACDTDPNCLHQGDFAMVEIIKNFTGQFFTIMPASQTQDKNLTLGGGVSASFAVTPLTGTTTGVMHQFTIRVSDIRRPDGAGGSTSILQNVMLNPGPGGTQGGLMVNP
jgi:hypothetical protein